MIVVLVEDDTCPVCGLVVSAGSEAVLLPGLAPKHVECEGKPLLEVRVVESEVVT